MNSEVAKKLATGVELSAAEAQGAHIFTDASAREMETMPYEIFLTSVGYTTLYNGKFVTEQTRLGDVVSADLLVWVYRHVFILCIFLFYLHRSQSQVPISYTKYYRAKDGHIVEAKVTGHIVPAQGVVWLVCTTNLH